MRKKLFKTEQGIVAYWVSNEIMGNRPTLVLLHGFSADHTMFASQIACFETDYNIIAWDAPGHGVSRPFVGFDMDVAVDILMDIAEHEGVDTFIAVGQSVGACVAQAVAARYPEALEAFIGIGALPYGESYYTQADFKMLLRGAKMSKCTPWTMLKVAAATAVSSTEAGYENMLRMVSVFDKKEYAQLITDYYQAFIQDNCDIELSCPVLLLYGDKDTVGKVREYGDAWHAQTGYPLMVVPGAGHNANVDNPEYVNACIQEFLDLHLTI